MAAKRTTHDLARLLDELARALREMPDIPLSAIRPTRKETPRPDIAALADSLPQMTREEAERRLAQLGQRDLVQLCTRLKLHTGSKRTKDHLAQQIVWHYFEAPDQLQRIRTYEEEPRREVKG